MIRKIQPQDIQAITDIYNFYVAHSTATFDLTPLTLAEMQTRLDAITAHHPCFVFDTDGEIAGYCYAHPWKERAAYSRQRTERNRQAAHEQTYRNLPPSRMPLTNSLHHRRKRSQLPPTRSFRVHPSLPFQRSRIQIRKNIRDSRLSTDSLNNPYGPHTSQRRASSHFKRIRLHQPSKPYASGNAPCFVAR